jgi:hypothetical protein
MTCRICELERCACRIETVAHLERALAAIGAHKSEQPHASASMRTGGVVALVGVPHARSYVSGCPSLSDALTQAVAAWWDEHGGGS